MSYLIFTAHDAATLEEAMLHFDKRSSFSYDKVDQHTRSVYFPVADDTDAGITEEAILHETGVEFMAWNYHFEFEV